MEFTVNNLDKAIVFNNMAKFQCLIKETEAAVVSMKTCFNLLKEEAEKIKLDRMKSINIEIETNILQKASLISFLYFNYGYLLEKYTSEKDSMVIFRKGYQFCMAILGENSLHTAKFKSKIYSKYNPIQNIPITNFRKQSHSLKNSFRIKNRISIDARSDSEVEELSFSLNNSMETTSLNLTKENFKINDQEDEDMLNSQFNNLTIKDTQENILQDILPRASKNSGVLIKKISKKNYENKDSKDSGDSQGKLKKEDFSPFSIQNIKNINISKLPIAKIREKPNKANSFYNSISNSQSFTIEKDSEAYSTHSKTYVNENYKNYSYIRPKSHNNIESSDSKNYNSIQECDQDKNYLESESDIPDAPKELPELRDLILKEKELKKMDRNKSKLKDIFGQVVNTNFKDSRPSAKDHRPSNLEKLLRGSGLFIKPDNTRKASEKYFKKDLVSIKKENLYNERMVNLENEHMDFEMVENDVDNIESLLGIDHQVTNRGVIDRLTQNLPTYSINIFNDSIDKNLYKSETYYIQDSEQIQGEVLLDENNKKKRNKRATEIFAFYLRSMKKASIYFESEKDMIQNEVDFGFLENENNYYKMKRLKESDIEEFFNNLIENYKFSDREITSFRKIEDNLVKVKISTGSWENDNGVYLSLFQEDNLHCEIFISFEKVSQFLTKIPIENLLPRNVDIYSITSIDMFLEKVFIHLCYPLINKEKKYSIAVLARPFGVFSYKSYDFEFLKSKCTMDFVILEGKFVSLLIYNKQHENQVLLFDVFLDNICFEFLFKELVNEKDQLSGLNEVRIPSYAFINTKQLNKNGIIQIMILRIQEIFKGRIQRDDITFQEVYEKFKNTVMKIQILNELKDISLWIVNNDNNYKWVVDYYTLMKIEISNNFYYVHKSIIIDSQEYYNIIGSNPMDSWDLLSKREKMMTEFLLLNSVKLRNINTKMLTEKNYDNMIKLMKISPTQLFKFNFTLRHRKQYFIVSTEILIYSNINFFIKLLMTESDTCRSYSKIFTPYYLFTCSPEINTLKKEVEESLSLNKKMLEDEEFRHRFKCVVQEFALGILQKKIHLKQFENVTVFCEKLLNIK